MHISYFQSGKFEILVLQCNFSHPSPSTYPKKASLLRVWLRVKRRRRVRGEILLPPPKITVQHNADTGQKLLNDIDVKSSLHRVAIPLFFSVRTGLKIRISKWKSATEDTMVSRVSPYIGVKAPTFSGTTGCLPFTRRGAPGPKVIYTYLPIECITRLALLPHCAP